MNKYIDADKLWVGIEKLQRTEYKPGGDFNEGRDATLEEVSLLITSLQQEQPEVDLEKEIELCWMNWLSPSNQKEVEGILPKTEFEMYARHFYKRGREVMRNYKEMLELLLGSISYAYAMTDGTYGSLSPVVSDKVRYIEKQLRELAKRKED